MANRKIGLGMLALALTFGMTVAGCDLLGKKIDSKFQGKWEVKSVEYSGDTYTLPWSVINSYGYKIDESSITTYLNGVVNAKAEGIYSDGNTFYDSSGRSGFTMKVSGKNATITLSLETDNCVKVSKFSWE